MSKAATLLQRNALAAVLQADAWIQSALPPGGEPLFVVCALPLYHIFALTGCYLVAARVGGVNLLIPNPRDISGLIKELQKYQVHYFPAVNTLYNALLQHPEFEKVDFTKLNLCPAGGVAVQSSVAEAGTGLPDARSWKPTVCRKPRPNLPESDRYDPLHRFGRLASSVYVYLDWDDEGRELPLGATGEISPPGHR